MLFIHKLNYVQQQTKNVFEHNVLMVVHQDDVIFQLDPNHIRVQENIIQDLNT